MKKGFYYIVALLTVLFALVVQHEEEHESEPFLSCLYDPL